MSAATWTVAGAPNAVFGSEWDPSNTANVMADKGDGTYKWEKSDLTLAASTIQFKVVKGNAWGEEYPSSNYELKIKDSGVYTITITFNEGTHEVNAVATKQSAAEVIPTIELAGDMTNWGDGKLEFTMAADELTASLTIPLEAQDYFFKMIIAGGWTSDGATITRENNTTVFTGANSDNNCTLTADVAGDYTFTWVYKTNTLTVTYPEAGENPGEEPGDDPIVTPTDAAYVLMGVGGDWETGIAFTRNEANTLEEEYMLLGQVISEGDSVKVVGIVDGVATYYNTVDEASVSHTLSEDYQNIVLAPGIYDFYFKVASQVIYIGASLPSAVDNVTVEGKAVKVIRNGQMYILRDGVMYNAIGQIAE